MSLSAAPYFALSSPTHLYIKGRVLKARRIRIKERHGMIKSMYYTFLRAMSREVDGVEVRLKIGGQVVGKTSSDHEGYYEFFLESPGAVTNVEVIATEEGTDICHPVECGHFDALGHMIVSDVDDTVLTSGIKSLFKIKMLYYTIFVNPFRRKPIADASAALSQMVTRYGANTAVVYLSNSPWNLADYLKTFLAVNDFPQGTLILRDIGIQLFRGRSIEHTNKYQKISRLIEMWPSRRLVLVGDSGEKDFYIYQAVREQFPERIDKIVIIRARNPKNEARIESLMMHIPNAQLISSYAELVDEL